VYAKRALISVLTDDAFDGNGYVMGITIVATTPMNIIQGAKLELKDLLADLLPDLLPDRQEEHLQILRALRVPSMKRSLKL